MGKLKYVTAFIIMALFSDELISLAVILLMLVFAACDVAKEVLK